MGSICNLTFGRPRQDDCLEFKVSLGCIMRGRVLKNKTKTIFASLDDWWVERGREVGKQLEKMDLKKSHLFECLNHNRNPLMSYDLFLVLEDSIGIITAFRPSCWVLHREML